MAKLTIDSDGNELRDGDLIQFGYGIPPIGVEARVVERGGKLIALTPQHNPKQCSLTQLKKNVGEFWKVLPKDEEPAEIEARIFRSRSAKDPSP